MLFNKSVREVTKNLKLGLNLDQAYEKAGFISFEIPKKEEPEKEMTPEQYRIMKKISWRLNPELRPKKKEKITKRRW